MSIAWGYERGALWWGSACIPFFAIGQRTGSQPSVARWLARAFDMRTQALSTLGYKILRVSSIRSFLRVFIVL